MPVNRCARPLVVALFMWFGPSFSASLAFAQEEAPTTVVPPEVVTRVDAVLGPDALSPGTDIEVIVTITVDRDGNVADARIAQSGGEEADAASLAAIQQWRFRPATQNGEPSASRINVPFTFRGPPLDSAVTEPKAAIGPNAATDPADDSVGARRVVPTPAASPTSPTEEAIEVTVVGERELRSDDRAASDFHVEREILAAAPRSEGAEVLRSAPGLYIGREEGAAVAHSYMLRGFDAEHGQDLELRVGGLPINQPSHVHGQGYADLGFLIGDVVRELHVSEGVYDPRQGDFAVAGTIDMELGVDENERGEHFTLGYGAFGSRRAQVLWAPAGGERETFGAAQITQTDGFGDNRAGDAGSAMLQARFGEGAWRYRVLGIAGAAQAQLAGMVRDDDVASGAVCFTCVYDVPTARAQNALSQRGMLGFFAEHRGKDGDNGELGLWLGYANHRVQGNHSGFLDSSEDEGDPARGDLNEQQNRAGSFGMDGRYRRAPTHLGRDVHTSVEVGASARFDVVDQSQAMLDASRDNQTWERVQNLGVRGMQLGLWADTDWRITRYVNARVGARGAMQGYDVNDRLALPDPVGDIAGVRRGAMGTTLGPRTSVEVAATDWLKLRAAYGEGYRSGQASLVTDGDDVPFTKVRSADLGGRFDFGEALQLTVGSFLTHVSSDLIFEAHENRLEQIGATRRVGLLVNAVTQPWRWLVASASLTWARATLVDGWDDNAPGSRVPNAPPLVFRLDAGVHHVLWGDLGGDDVSARVGLGATALSARPLSGGGTTPAFATVDASLGVAWSGVSLSLEVYNLFDVRYAALATRMESRWDLSAPASDAVHTAAGSPRAWMMTLGVALP